MNYKKRIKIWLSVLKSLIATFSGVNGQYLDAEMTVSLVSRGKSLIRLGDGEFGIYREKDIHYQRWSPELQKMFEIIKNDYETNSEHCPYLLAVPRRFMTVNGFQLAKRRVYVSSWAESRYDFKKNFKHDIPYGDAFLFDKNNRGIYSEIWDNPACPENVIFIHNSESYARYFADTYHKNTVFVQCPPRNAFEDIDKLQAQVMAVIEENGWGRGCVMLTISAGPAGKVLVYRFSKQGYWCIDAGHCWDEPLEGI